MDDEDEDMEQFASTNDEVEDEDEDDSDDGGDYESFMDEMAKLDGKKRKITFDRTEKNW